MNETDFLKLKLYVKTKNIKINQEELEKLKNLDLNKAKEQVDKLLPPKEVKKEKTKESQEEIKRKQELEEKEREIRKKMIEEFNKQIEEIKSKTNPEIDKYFEVLKEMIKIAVRQEKITGMIIYGEAGLGKTYTILKTLGELGLKAGVVDDSVNGDYYYIASHITSVELYNLLYKYRDKIIVIDDVEQLLENLKSLAILKSALWSSIDKRYVYYHSPTHLLEAPKEFEFKGKIFLLLNKIPTKNKEVIDSLMSRVLTYKLHFDYQTRIKIMYEISKLFKIPLEITDYLKDKYTPALENFNFRTLVQISTIYEYYKQNPPTNGVNWKVITDKLIEQNSNPILSIVWQLMNSNLSVNEQVREFGDKTGYSRRTYFRLKNQLKETLGIKK
jgi:hypothetical protein